jgi:aminoglycoside 6'-N-acetyltransferase
VLSLRPMTEPDLLLVAGWLRQPHVIRWWGDTTVEVQAAKYRDRIRLGSGSATHMLTVLNDGTPAGWCQWYRWSDFPDDAAGLKAGPGEVGLDYAIGDPASTGPGAGTELIAALVAEVRRHHPAAGFLVDPDADNAASRRVLEKNGFLLAEVRPVATEPAGRPMAIYRLPGAAESKRPWPFPGQGL